MKYPIRLQVPSFTRIIMLAAILSGTVLEAIGGCVPLPSGLVGWWPAEGDANDVIGGNNGILRGNAGFAAGEAGQAFSFDGTGDFVEIPYAPSLDVVNQLTIDFWMKADAGNPMNTIQGLVTSDYYYVGINNGLESRFGINFGISVNNGGNYFQISEANGGSAVISSGQWHHIAGTYDGTKLQLYIDGQPWGNPISVTGSISPMLAGSFVAVGSEDGRTACGNCAGARYFKGLMDEVDIFNRALSASEITAIYNAGAAGKCLAPTAPFIFVQPASQTVIAAASVTFSNVAGGTPPLSYQWRFNGTNIADATDATLILTDVQPAQAGTYSVEVANDHGLTDSSNAVLTVNPPPPCAALPLGLVGWWRAEGDAADQLGANNGTLQNSATFAAGQVSQAFSCDGAGGYVRVPKAGSLDVGNQLTIDFWMKADPSNPMNTIQGLVTSDFYSIGINGGLQPRFGINFSISVNNGGFFYQVSEANGGGAPVSANQWHHVAGVYDGSKIQLYIDGQRWGSPTLVTGVISPMLANSFVAFGAEDGRTSCGNCNGNRYFSGLLDEVDIFNRALSANEIAAIYNAGVSGKCVAPTGPFIFVQPTNRTVQVGTDLTLSAIAGGTPPLAYQWRLGGTNLAGSTNSLLSLTNVQLSQAGTYSLQVANAYGTTNSSDAVLTVNPPPPCLACPTGVVAWWAGAGDASDQVGTNNGTLRGGVTFALGQVGQAFSFDGVSGSVLAPDAPALRFTNAMTIETWISPKSWGGNPREIVSKWNGNGSQFSYSTSIDTSGKAYFLVSSDGLGNTAGVDYTLVHITNTIALNQWSHFAATYDGASLKVYLNGALENQASWTRGVFPGTAPLVIGEAYSQSLFNGMIDEPALYNRALSQAEIQAIYNAANSGKCGLAPTILVPPKSQVVTPGANVTFSVMAGGKHPFSYRGMFNGANLGGATNTSLTLSNVQPGNAGSYSVTVSNGIGSATSSSAVLKVNVVFAFGNGLPLTNAQTSFSGPVTVQLQNAYSYGLMFFTLDGSAPTFTSTQYSGPFIVSHDVVLRVLGYSADFFQSGELDPTTILIVPVYSLIPATSGGGSIALNPTGGSYLSNAVVGVTATAASGWTFLQWLGDLTGTNPVASVTMGGNRRVTAVFGTLLNTTAAGNGSVALSPPGGMYPYGSVVTLAAIPQAGSYFGLWGNAASGNVNPLYFTVTNSSPTVSCLFASLAGGQAALVVEPSGHGRVTVNPRANVYTLGTGVTLTAVSDAGQSFLGWAGDASGTNSPLSITMDQSKVITANFTRKPILTANAASGGLTDEGFRLTLVH